MGLCRRFSRSSGAWRSLVEGGSQQTKAPATIATRSRISKTRASCMRVSLLYFFFPHAPQEKHNAYHGASLRKGVLFRLFAHGRGARAVSDAPITVAPRVRLS